MLPTYPDSHRPVARYVYRCPAGHDFTTGLKPRETVACQKCPTVNGLTLMNPVNH